MAIPDSVKQAIDRRKAEGVKRRGGRTPQWLFPESVERSYRRQLFNIVDILEQSISDTLLMELPSLYKQANQVNTDSIKYDPWVVKQNFAFIRSDDWARDLNSLMNASKVLFDRRIPQVESLTSDIAKETSDFNQKQFDRVTQAALGVNVLAMDPDLQTRLNAFAFRNADLIKDIGDKTVKDISVIASQGLTQGKSLKTIESEIQSKFPMAKRRASLIARDQIATLNGNLTKVRQKSVGIEKFRWSTVGDDRVRDEHAALDGKVFSWDNLPSEGAPGDAINCVISGTQINITSYINTIFKRFYTGSIVEITDIADIKISITPNHPILTDRGWVAAKDIQSSDKLFKSFDPEMLNIFNADINNRNITCDTIFDFFNIMRPAERTIGTNTQFHGDGIVDKQIEVIDIPGKLLFDNKISIPEEFRQFIFTDAFASMSNLKPFTPFLAEFFTFLFTNNCLMSFENLSLPLIESHLFPFKGFRFRLRSDFYSVFNQSSSNNITSSIKKFCDFIFANSIQIQGTDFIDIEIFSVPTSSFLFHKTPIKLIETKDYQGDVYNFTTDNGTYQANDIIVHNCRCTAIPVFDDFL